MRSPADRTQYARQAVHADALRAAPYPMLVLDPDGSLAQISAVAERLAGGASLDVAAPWLLRAHREFLDSAPASQVAPGSVSGTPTPVLDAPVLDTAAPEAAPAPAPARGTLGGREMEARPVALPGGAVAWWLSDDGRTLAERELRTYRERTALLAQLSGSMLSSLNVRRCMALAARHAAEHLAEAAVVVSPAAGRRIQVMACVRGGEPAETRVVADPSGVPGLAEALRGFPPVPSRWIDPGSAPGWLVPEDFGPVGAMSVTPLPGHGVPAGAMVLLRSEGHGVFTDDEEAFARLFAARAGAAVSAATMYSEQAATTDLLMRELLPPRLGHIGGVGYAGGYSAAAERERIGGDFYDVHPAVEPGGEDLAVLGDVCGKGMEAAVLTGKIRNTLHALLPLADDHERLLNMLNRALLTSRHARFASMVLASVRRQEDGVRLRLASAGHPAPLIVRAGGQVEEAPTRGCIVGALDTVSTTPATVTLAPGEACVLYSDGITEARGGPMGGREMFGEDRLRAALAECAGLPAEAIVERVQMLASQWVGRGSHDDMAVLAIAAPYGARLSMVGGAGVGRFTP